MELHVSYFDNQPHCASTRIIMMILVKTKNAPISFVNSLIKENFHCEILYSAQPCFKALFTDIGIERDRDIAKK